MNRSNMGIIKALNRLSGCAGWSTPLLFANYEDPFSHVEAHLLMVIGSIFYLDAPQRHKQTIFFEDLLNLSVQFQDVWFQCVSEQL